MATAVEHEDYGEEGFEFVAHVKGFRKFRDDVGRCAAGLAKFSEALEAQLDKEIHEFMTDQLRRLDIEMFGLQSIRVEAPDMTGLVMYYDPWAMVDRFVTEQEQGRTADSAVYAETAERLEALAARLRALAEA